MNDEDDGITRIMLSADDSDGLCMGPKTTWGLGVVVKSLRPLATKVVESEEMLCVEARSVDSVTSPTLGIRGGEGIVVWIGPTKHPRKETWDTR